MTDGQEKGSAMRKNTHGQRKMKIRRVCVALVVSAGVSLAVVTSAPSATSSPVVPLGGKVAGEGYPYYLELYWQRFFAQLPPVPCQTLRVGGTKIAYLGAATGGSYTCHEPAGRGIYAPQQTGECSTLKGDNKGGTTPADLERCARAVWHGIPYTLTLDGHPIDLGKLVTATGVYFVPKVALHGVSAKTAHSAAYGAGLLLSGLTPGTHTLVGRNPDIKKPFKYTIHVA
jgi:hypothetical protein